MTDFYLPGLDYDDDDNIVSDVNEIDGSFVAVFDISSHIKALFTHLHATNTEGNLVFREDSITYRAKGQRGSILNDIRIDTEKLPYYAYESTSDAITVGIEISEMKNNVTMARKDVKLMLSKQSGINILTVDLFTGEYPDNVSYISMNDMIMKNIGHNDQSVPEYDDPLIVTQSLKDVAKIFNNCNVNNNKVNIGKSQSGILLHGEINNGITNRRLMLGQCGTDIDQDSYRLVVSGKTLKSLSKIAGINNTSDKSSIATLLFEDNKPMRLDLNISSNYGVLSIYIAGE